MKNLTLNRTMLCVGVLMSAFMVFVSSNHPVLADGDGGCYDGGCGNDLNPGYCEYRQDGQPPNYNYCSCTTGTGPNGTWYCSEIGE